MTVHDNNLMDTPYRPAPGTLSWLDIVAMPRGATFVRESPGRYRADGFDDYSQVTSVRDLTLDPAGGRGAARRLR